MKLSISPPIQLAIAAAITCSAVVMLYPEPVEHPVLGSAPKESVHATRLSGLNPDPQGDQPWKRSELPIPTAGEAPSSEAAVLPPLPPQTNTTADADRPPPLPTSHSEPAQHDVVYLGRMIKDDKTQVFLAIQGEPHVVSQGEVLNGSWLVQSVSSSNVTLRHVESGKIHVIAMGDGTVSHATDVKAVQIGPRYLASGPVRNQENN